MAKPLIDTRFETQAVRAVAPPLTASVRRHIGRNLQTMYADTLAAPVSERLEALLARLDTAKR